jgi:DNA anti-recombination protein RmuC
MQGIGTEPIDWTRTALLLGVVLTILTILTRLKWIGSQLAKLVTWMARRAILTLIKSDSKEAHDWLIGLLPEVAQLAKLLPDLEGLAEVRALREQLQGVATRTDDARKLVRNLEEAMVKFEDQQVSEMRDVRFDVQRVSAQQENAAREMRNSINALRDTLEHSSREMTHTILSAILGTRADNGGEDVRQKMRERMDQRSEEGR